MEHSGSDFSSLCDELIASGFEASVSSSGTSSYLDHIVADLTEIFLFDGALCFRVGDPIRVEVICQKNLNRFTLDEILLLDVDNEPFAPFQHQPSIMIHHYADSVIKIPYNTEVFFKTVLVIPLSIIDGQPAFILLFHIEKTEYPAENIALFSNAIRLLTKGLAAVCDREYQIKRILSLEESESRLSLALNATGEGIWDWNIQTNEIFYNDRFFSMIGYPPNSLAGMYDSITTLMVQEDITQFKNRLNAFINGETPQFESEFRIMSNTGSIVWISSRGIAVSHDTDGKPLRLLGTHADISRQKLLEKTRSELAERYKNVVTNAIEGIFVSSNNRIMYCNRAFADIAGYSLRDLINKKISDIIHPDDFHAVKSEFTRRLSVKEHPRMLEYRIIHSDGHPVWIEDNGSLVSWDGNPALLDLITDVTARRQTQIALHESEKRYRLLFLKSPLGVFHFNTEMIITDCNDHFAEIMRNERSEIIGKSFDISTVSGIKIALESALEGENGVFEGEYHWGGGIKGIQISLRSSPITDEHGTITGGIAIIEDITSRVETEKSLVRYLTRLESIDRISQILSSALDMQVIIHTVVREIRRIFNASCAWLAYPCDIESQSFRIEYFSSVEAGTHSDIKEIRINESWKQLIHESLSTQGPLFYPVFPEGAQSEFSTKSALHVALRPIAGKPWLFALHSYHMRDWATDDIKLLNDISHRLNDSLNNLILHHALMQEKETLSVTLQSIGDGVITTDLLGRIILINRAAAHMAGVEVSEAVGMQWNDVFILSNDNSGKRIFDPLETTLKTGKAKELITHVLLTSRKSHTYTVSVASSPVREANGEMTGAVVAIRDMTDRILAEHELQKSQRLESIGLLAGGIAHDFNNILTGILGSLSLVKMDTPAETESYELLSEAEGAALRARNLTAQLLTFARGGAPVRETASLQDIIDESARFTLRGSNILLEFNFDPSTPRASIDRNQFAQAIQNIVLNSKQAMTNGGTVTIESKSIKTEPYPLPYGHYAMITISDNGPGIPQEDLPMIFDPYFSTKDMGSGLGLAVVYSIITNHDGVIRVNTKVGEGTIFTIYLPAELSDVPQKKPNVPVIGKGSGNILILDDDASVLRVLEAMLHKLGYTVTSTNEGSITVEKYRIALEKNTPYSCVIMDLTIPGGMGGKDAVVKIRELDPNARVVASSGYSNDPVMANAQAFGFDGIITKPYRMEDLSETMNKIHVL